MTPPQFSPPTLVEHQENLNQLANRLKDEKRLAVDIESNSLFAYQEQVCLIQISTAEEDYILDPLAIDSLEPVGPLFSDAQIEKVFHAAEYDLMSLKRDLDIEINNLFDTQIAARTLGRKRTGLASMLEEEFNVKLNKRFQRANWGKRPLEPAMLDYARMDTHYLIELRSILIKQLESAGMMVAAQEAFLWQTRVAPANHNFDPNGFWKITQKRRLTKPQLTALKELYIFREKEASQRNRPPFKIMNDEILLTLAVEAPQTLDQLRRLPGMTEGQVRRFGRGILDAIKRSRSMKAPHRPRGKRTDPDVIERYEMLKQWRKEAARQRGVDSDIVLPREVLWKLANDTPTEPEELEALMQPLAWRYETFGDDILRILDDAPST